MHLCLAHAFTAPEQLLAPLRAQTHASCSGRPCPGHDTASPHLQSTFRRQRRRSGHKGLLPPVQSITFEEGECVLAVAAWFKPVWGSASVHWTTRTAVCRLAPDIDAGTKVRVTADLIVYHVPKNKEMQLKGWEGEVAENVVNYKGSKISANLPYKVQFLKPTEGEGKDLKFFCHLVSLQLICLCHGGPVIHCCLTDWVCECSVQTNLKSCDGCGQHNCVPAE